MTLSSAVFVGFKSLCIWLSYFRVPRVFCEKIWSCACGVFTAVEAHLFYLSCVGCGCCVLLYCAGRKFESTSNLRLMLRDLVDKSRVRLKTS